MTDLKFFLYGGLVVACATAALALLRFFTVTRDRLFLFFSLAFAVFAVNWLVLAIADPPAETRHYVYLLRLASFLLIIVGIVDKNRRVARSAG